jgi:uncharacterized membrane protein YjjP (DUF1212 family)
MNVKYDYERIVQGILDIGEAMIRCGAENFRLQDSLYRICRSYGFVKYDIFVIPSNIQITAETPEGQIITQIRLVEIGECDFDKLDYLNNLCRKICKEKPDAKEMRRQFEEVMGRPEQKWYTHYAAGILGGTGFAVFFGCDIRDAIIAVIVSIVIVAAGNWLAEREKNLLAYNLILSFIAEMIILLSVKFGFADHEERIMIGIVMLLISGLSTTNGIRDLLQKDFISGSINIMNSMLGASGIAFGTAIPMILFGGVEAEGYILTPNLTEACILTDTPYTPETFVKKDYEALLMKIAEYGAKKIVITGIDSGIFLTNYIYDTDKGIYTTRQKRVGHVRSGTGDVFSAIIAADAVHDIDFRESVKRASSFVKKCIEVTETFDIPPTDGVCFEEVLHTLKCN